MLSFFSTLFYNIRKEVICLASLSITACSFYLRKKNSRTTRDVYNLNDSFSITMEDGKVKTYSDYSMIFRDFFESHAMMQIDSAKQQSFQCEYEQNPIINNEEYKVYCAKVYSGDYGSSSEIINSATKESRYKKEVDDIDVKPFFVFLIIPKDNDRIKIQKGMLFFQNIGPYGIKTITTTKMQDYFSKKYDLSIQCNCIAPKLFIEKVLKKNKLNKISLIKNYKSNDKSDNISKGYGTEVRELSNLDLSENQFTNLLESIKYASGGKYNLFEFERIHYHNAKIQVKIGEHVKTINVHNIDKLSIIEEIPDDIKSIDGHPDKDKLIDYVKNTIDDYLSEMVLTVGERDLNYDE